MKPGWFEDVNQDYVPYLEELWSQSKVEVPTTDDATMVKDIVHHYSNESATIEAIDGKLYVMFLSQAEKELKKNHGQ